MNPLCGRCNKAVYPTEKLNCLDKYWHKGCFNCEVCKMTLNMKNYQGFDKKPYCSMHYPKTSFTIVTDTPENLRLKEQSKMNSLIKYHEDFEKSRIRSDAPPPENATQENEQQFPANPLSYSHQAEPVRTAEKRFRAVYSYTATDADEVSLQEGDLVVDVQQIDEGWMYGRIERTGQQGMLPANYVQLL
ncbi:LIM and SH3 domain protein 1 isoform X2 [Hypomesus transpacificus]|uniref:LIM and SH3 domain protein 1 isoform X2 n=1 Tax=Hypomesus transpacificus TaxID=137520 RepID=UPI001F078F3B|nr:LIM and SH3 domain protein 1 isoform X2 [Hypomesus transpacificus]